MPPDLRLVALNAKALGIWYNPQRIAHDHLLQSERTAGVTIGDIFVPPSLREPSYALNSSRIGMVAAGPSALPTSPDPPHPRPSIRPSRFRERPGNRLMDRPPAVRADSMRNVDNRHTSS